MTPLKVCDVRTRIKRRKSEKGNREKERSPISQTAQSGLQKALFAKIGLRPAFWGKDYCRFECPYCYT
jgi:hypothetical protein